MKRFGWFGTVVAALALTMHPVTASADDLLNTLVQLVPPLLLNSEQPLAPSDGYIWQPGYWSWGQSGYYWVPGAWVQPPQYGDVWTPGYWSYNASQSGYNWQPGYWDNQVGYYGGIDYGNGYYGNGYVGGRWDGNVYRYNTAVTHVRPTVRYVYVDRTVVNDHFVRTSYNGGKGIRTRPTAWQVSYGQRHHRGMTAQQERFREAASRDPHLRYHAASRAPQHTQTYRAPQHTQTHRAPQHTQTQRAPQHTQTQRAPQHTQTQRAPQHTQTHRAPQHTQPQRAPQHTHTQRAPQHTQTQHGRPPAAPGSTDSHHSKHPPSL